MNRDAANLRGLLALVAASSVVWAIVSRAVGAEEKDQKPKEEEPLLLLDDDGDEPQQGGADNSRCHVCHLNFATEELAVLHGRKQIGCEKCHGSCDAHIADESWASGGPGTPPDTMYPPEAIDPACRKCHPTHDAPARKVIARWLARGAKKPPSAVVCTDCHGHHRLIPKLRKAWWDKRTRKPIPRPK